MLAAVLPAQADRLRVQYDEALAAIPDGPAERGGIAVGGRAAATMIAARENDGSEADAQWAIGTEPGRWRPTPPLNTGDGAEAVTARYFKGNRG